MATVRGRLQDRVAIVTGGASGIGREICLAYANEGACVVVADVQRQSVDPSQIEDTVSLIQQAHGADRALFIETDVTKSASVNDLVQQTVRKYARLDIMVNNAGSIAEVLSPRAIFDDWEDSLMDRVIDINMKGPFYCCRAASKQMITQDPLPSGDRGWIINMSSIYGHLAAEHAPVYTATKHAVNGLTRSAALACGPHMVHVNAICPGFVATTQIDPLTSQPGFMEAVSARHALRGLGRPEYIPGIAIFLASDDAKWVNGECMVVDGGYSAQ